MDDDDDSQAPKKTMFFGRDLSAIPCFRSTFLKSISSGLFLGFAYFMFTSKTKQAVHVGYFSFVGVTVGYWVYCRYNWAYNKRDVQRLLTAARNQTIFEGTEIYPEQEKNTKEA